MDCATVALASVVSVFETALAQVASEFFLGVLCGSYRTTVWSVCFVCAALAEAGEEARRGGKGTSEGSGEGD